MSDIRAIIKIMSDLSNLGEEILFHEEETRKMKAELDDSEKEYLEMDNEIKRLKKKLEEGTNENTGQN